MKYVLGIDIGSIEIKAVIARIGLNNEFSIVGYGKSETFGVKKGIITNIDQARNSIKKAVNIATQSSGTQYDKVVVSISGTSLKTVKANGIISITNSEKKIKIDDIKRVMEMVKCNIPFEHDHQVLHILPYSFKVDENIIEDPLGMSGSRLQVFSHVILVSNNALNSLISSIKTIGIEIDNIVYSGYASSISTLNKDEKEAGVAIIDMGGATCNCAIYYANSIINNFTLLVGSANVTLDLSNALKTPIREAEAVKLNYMEFIEDNVTHVELPVTGGDNKKVDVSLKIITDVIHSRISETLYFLYNQLEKLNKESAHYMLPSKINRIVLTGGMPKLPDLIDFALAIFSHDSVRVAKPRSVSGLHEVSEDSANSCVVGLCMYGSGYFTPYEIDSNNKILYKEDSIATKNFTDLIGEMEHKNPKGKNDNLPQLKISEEEAKTKQSPLDKATNPVKKIWRFLLQLY